MADCLCVLFRNREGTIVGAAHAGWRGLVDGVLEATVRAMNVDPTSIQAWLSPAIGPDAFEVAEDVRARIISASQGSAAATQSATLAAIATSRARTDRWHVDLFALARIRLGQCGVLDHHIYGGGMCTYSDPARFFSHRRATHELRKTGRMAALIAIV
jgi:YfiH family protein